MEPAGVCPALLCLIPDSSGFAVKELQIQEKL